MGTGQQLRYLLYRNYLFKRRNVKQTVYEIVSVLYFVAILAVIRSTAVKTETKKAVYDDKIPRFDLVPPQKGEIQVGYVIADGSNKTTGEGIVQKLNTSVAPLKFTKFTSLKDLEDAHKQAPKTLKFGLVIDFSKTTKKVRYTLKVPYDTLPEADNLMVPKKQDKCRNQLVSSLMNKGACPVNSYFTSGFVVLQSYLEAATIEVVSGVNGYFPPNITIQMAPKDSFTPPTDALKNIVGLYLVLSFSPYVMFLLTFIVTEKEKKIKEAMKIMGLNMYIFWVGWFITYAIVIGFGVILVTSIAIGAKIFGSSNFVIILITLLLFGLSIETMAFMLTPLFSKGRSAGGFGSLFTTIVGALGLIHVYVNTSKGVKWITCFLSPVALSLVVTPAADAGEGLQWHNIHKGEFPPLYAMLMLLLDVFLYLFLAIYLDAVFPGEYGIKKHPLFFLKPSFWRSKSKTQTKRHPSFMRSMSVKQDSPQEDVEDVPPEMEEKKVISIRKLVKVFTHRGREDVKALNGISLDVYEGQITALLGHNGAGKSTLIALLTGLLPSTSGKAIIYGFDMNSPEDLERIRSLSGFCPQQDIVFEELNPVEHLTFYAGIKGIPPNDIRPMVEEVLKEVDLDSQRTTMSKNLSGGQKRKLCVGIALIGDPKVVFLDEPTSGMDPASRRKMWSLLQRKREERVIFLTTHFMDEADILADYKAIISKGKLRCAGSSLYLKNRFGIGYHLGMVIDPNCEKNKIFNLVSGCVPGSSVSREHSKELAFRLPLASVDKFPGLFMELEKFNETGQPCSASAIGINSYGVSMTTLEEVFLKLDDQQDKEEGDGDRSNGGFIVENGEGDKFVEDGIQLANMSGPLMNNGSQADSSQTAACRERVKHLAWQQFWALFEIRAWLSTRMPAKIIFQVIIPPIFVIVGLVLMRNTGSQNASTMKTLNLKPSTYVQQNGGSKQPTFLLKNSTGGGIPYVLQGLKDEGIQYDLVKDLSKLLDIKPHNLAADLESLPTKNKLEYLLRYNDSALHSIPVGINIISNVLLRSVLASNGQKFDGKGEPIEFLGGMFDPTKPPWKYDYSAFVSVLLLSMCFALLPAGFAVEVVRYREEGVRHQFRVNGAGRFVYWLHFLLGDMIFYSFPVLLAYIMIAALNVLAFNSSTAMGAMGLLLIFYIPVSLLWVYCFSFIFSKWETAQSVLPSILIFLSMIPYVIVSTVDLVSGDIKGMKAGHIVHIVFLFIDPPYAIFGGLYYISRIWRVESILAQDNKVSIASDKYFDLTLENGLPITYVALVVEFFFYSWILYCLDSYKAGGVTVFPFSLCTKNKVSTSPDTRPDSADQENADVKLEREKVYQLHLRNKVDEKSVVVQGLHKDFDKKKVVKNVSFSVDKGEVFGLLGPNGAGKTTTLNMLTADFQPTHGQVAIGGFNIKEDLASAFQSLGFCPQHGGLIELCTAREHLKCFALLKGIPRDCIDSIITHNMAALKITEHADKKVKELSGGTKRKLSFLISMMGDPNTVLLDEPSTGMDPAARRFLWTAISKNIHGQRGAILTTHSMEEADALCTRVGIIVKGRLRCIGTTQELKSNYGGGYQLEIKAKSTEDTSAEDAIERVKDFVKEIFPTAVMLEGFGSRVTFKIANKEVKNLSEVFKKFEEGKTTVNIEEYSFSQSTLEQVFLEFAKEQDDELTGQAENGAVVAERDIVAVV